MIKQIEGQLNLIDLMQDKTGYGIGEQYSSEGYTNAYDAMPDHPCKVDVIDHDGNRFRIECVESFGSMAFNVGHRGKGYDICWWREVEQKACAGCMHFHEVVSGLGDIYHDTACLKDHPWARFKKPEDPACKEYKPRKEDESADQ